VADDSCCLDISYGAFHERLRW